MFKTGLMQPQVFITDGHWRKTLAAVRSLGQKGLRVTVGESTRLAVSLFSRYCNRAVVYPSPLQQPDDFLDWLHHTLSRGSYRLLLTMNRSGDVGLRTCLTIVTIFFEDAEKKSRQTMTANLST